MAAKKKTATRKKKTPTPKAKPKARAKAVPVGDDGKRGGGALVIVESHPLAQA